MKTISSSEMSQLNGGGFWDTFCVGVGIVALVAPNPVAGALGVGCLIGDFIKSTK